MNRSRIAAANRMRQQARPPRPPGQVAGGNGATPAPDGAPAAEQGNARRWAEIRRRQDELRRQRQALAARGIPIVPEPAPTQPAAPAAPPGELPPARRVVREPEPEPDVAEVIAAWRARGWRD
jgi:hypothetical protein